MSDRILTHRSSETATETAIVDGSAQPGDRDPEVLSLRPERLDEYVGQAEAVAHLVREERQKLIDGLNAQQLPSYAGAGVKWVEQGALGRRLQWRLVQLAGQRGDGRTLIGEIAEPDRLEAAFERAAGDEVFVIGGETLFERTIDCADRVYLTLVHAEVVERVVWEVVPELAEAMIREELHRLVGD